MGALGYGILVLAAAILVSSSSKERRVLLPYLGAAVIGVLLAILGR